MTAGARFASSLRLDEAEDGKMQSRKVPRGWVKGEGWPRGWGESRVECTKQSGQTAIGAIESKQAAGAWPGRGNKTGGRSRDAGDDVNNRPTTAITSRGIYQYGVEGPGVEKYVLFFSLPRCEVARPEAGVEVCRVVK